MEGEEERKGEEEEGKGERIEVIHSETKALRLLATVNAHLKVLYLGDGSLIFSKLTLYNGHIFHHCHPRDLVCVYVCAKFKPTRFRLILALLQADAPLPYVLLLY